MKLTHFVSSLTLVALAVFNTAAYAKSSDDFSPMQKQQIEGVVHDYLLKNPDVVVQSLQTYQQKQMEQAQQTMRKTQSDSPKFADALFHQNNDPVVGNPNGKITIVEFFDYQCSHCVSMSPLLENLVKTNSDVKIIFKEFPIRGPVSEFASKAALAAKDQGKYAEFHNALMALAAKQQPLNQEAILGVAKSVGLDVDKLKTAINSNAVNQQLKDNFKLAQQLQLLGTPAFFIAKSNVTKNSPSTAIVFVPGEMDQSQLQQVLTKVGQ